MSRWDSYLNTARNVIAEFDGRVPLSAWLKDFFRLNRQMGSTDRKLVSGMLYGFYRLGSAVKDLPVKERILLGLFLSGASENSVLNYFKPAWNQSAGADHAEKLRIAQEDIPGSDTRLTLEDIFPWKDELSAGIDPLLFSESFLQQPDLFLRLRPGKESLVTSRLEEAGIPYKKPAANCISLPNATNAAPFAETDAEAVIQDFNSQRTGDFFPADAVSVWDCCAGSGGKSIMAFDNIPGIQLTVSDVRKPILENLEDRFAKAGIKEYTSMVTDLSDANCKLPAGAYDLIIADLPCTGSGTWARTPEQLYFFNPSKISLYTTLQKNILSNAVTRLKPGGRLVYITCSVFKKENEEVASFTTDKLGLQLKDQQVLAGYKLKADSMFAAVFTR